MLDLKKSQISEEVLRIKDWNNLSSSIKVGILLLSMTKEEREQKEKTLRELTTTLDRLCEGLAISVERLKVLDPEVEWITVINRTHRICIPKEVAKNFEVADGQELSSDELHSVLNATLLFSQMKADEG